VEEPLDGGLRGVLQVPLLALWRVLHVYATKFLADQRNDPAPTHSNRSCKPGDESCEAE